jgi:hypothetical protein
MSNEHEAAERLRRIDNGESSYHVYGYDQNPTLYGETVDDCEATDRYLLADAYLRLMDETPITVEWLESIGVTYQSEFQLYCESPNGWFEYDADNGEVCIRGDKMPKPPTTRGEVLMLLRALKIEVKGGGDE